jgi:hypothetical protein
MKESTIRKLQRTKGGNSENRASKELWEENLDELENKVNFYLVISAHIFNYVL